MLLCTVALVNRGACCEAHLLSGTEGEWGEEERVGASEEGSGLPHPIPKSWSNHLPVCLLVRLAGWLAGCLSDCVCFLDIVLSDVLD